MRSRRLWSVIAASATALASGGLLVAAATISGPTSAPVRSVTHHVIYEVNVLAGDTTRGNATVDYRDPETGARTVFVLGPPFSWRLDEDVADTDALWVRVTNRSGAVLGCAVLVDGDRVAEARVRPGAVDECTPPSGTEAGTNAV